MVVVVIIVLVVVVAQKGRSTIITFTVAPSTTNYTTNTTTNDANTTNTNPEDTFKYNNPNQSCHPYGCSGCGGDCWVLALVV